MTLPKLSKNSLFSSGRLLNPGIWLHENEEEIWLIGPELTVGLALHAGSFEIEQVKADSGTTNLTIAPKGPQAAKLRPLFIKTEKIWDQPQKLAALLRRSPGEVRPNRFFWGGRQTTFEYFQPETGRKWRLQVGSNQVDRDTLMFHLSEPATIHCQMPEIGQLPAAFTKKQPRLAWLASYYLATGEPVGCLEFLLAHQNQLPKPTTGRLYLGLNRGFNRVYRAAQNQKLEADVTQIQKFATKWAELSWWQNNLALPIFLLAGLGYCEGAQISSFQKLAQFTVENLNSFPARQLTYQEQWLMDFLPGSIQPLPENLETKQLIAQARNNLLENYQQLQLDQAEIKQAFDNFQ